MGEDTSTSSLVLTTMDSRCVLVFVSQRIQAPVEFDAMHVDSRTSTSAEIRVLSPMTC
ncbi:hypothetical protein HALDL1_04165 [Halobacterium sp. DL1]|nr:hypothetical protein HALDL1_04165 [Halobacterium sp. DL1]